MTRALILAAGQGSRLRPLTDDRPKCLVELAGRSLRERQVEVLARLGIVNPVVVAGYRSEMIEALGHTVILNPRYARTNMVETLFCARAAMGTDQDLVIAYGDIVYEPGVLQRLLHCRDPLAVIVDRNWREYWARRFPEPLQDAETLKLGPGDRLLELGRKPRAYAEIQAQYIGLIKVRADHVQPLVHTYEALDRHAFYDGKDFANMYMTSFIQHLVDAGWHVQAVPVDGGWLELDSLQDYHLYQRLGASGQLARHCRLE